jgi:uncharacterized DUF497 family protein
LIDNRRQRDYGPALECECECGDRMAGAIDWDDAKNRRNRRDHGVDLSAAVRFEWDTATLRIDDRHDYGELREIAKGFIGDVLHVLVFTRRVEAIRAISLRKATKKKKERNQYVEETR